MTSCTALGVRGRRVLNSVAPAAECFRRRFQFMPDLRCPSYSNRGSHDLVRYAEEKSPFSARRILRACRI